MEQYLGAKKILRIYIDNEDKYNGKPLWEELLKKAKTFGLAGATVFKGVAGIGVHSKIKTFSVFVLSQELPIIIEMIDSHDKIMSFIDAIDDIVEEGLVTITDTQVIRYKHK